MFVQLYMHSSFNSFLLESVAMLSASHKVTLQVTLLPKPYMRTSCCFVYGEMLWLGLGGITIYARPFSELLPFPLIVVQRFHKSCYEYPSLSQAISTEITSCHHPPHIQDATLPPLTIQPRFEATGPCQSRPSPQRLHIIRQKS